MLVAGKESLTLSWTQLGAALVIIIGAVWALLSFELSDIRTDVDNLVQADTSTRSDMSDADTSIRDQVHNVDLAVARIDTNVKNLSQQMQAGFSSVDERLSEISRTLIEIDKKLVFGPKLDGGLFTSGYPAYAIQDWTQVETAAETFGASQEGPVVLMPLNDISARFLESAGGIEAER